MIIFAVSWPCPWPKTTLLAERGHVNAQIAFTNDQFFPNAPDKLAFGDDLLWENPAANLHRVIVLFEVDNSGLTVAHPPPRDL